MFFKRLGLVSLAIGVGLGVAGCTDGYGYGGGGIGYASDPYYGGAGTLKGEPVPRLMLHAASLDIPHPTAGGRITIKAPPPADFLTFLSAAGLEMPADLALGAS